MNSSYYSFQVSFPIQTPLLRAGGAVDTHNICSKISCSYKSILIFSTLTIYSFPFFYIQVGLGIKLYSIFRPFFIISLLSHYLYYHPITLVLVPHTQLYP